MSDFLSSIFLLATLVLALFLIIIVLSITRLGKKRRYLNVVVFCIVYGLLSIWIVDRFVVGLFCMPWECVKTNITVENLLLDIADLPKGWVVKFTYDYAYVPRASSTHIVRSYHNELKSINNEFYQEIYQYRSVRGALIQYTNLKNDFPRHFSSDNKLIALRANLPNNHANAYVLGYLSGSRSRYYYIARYAEFVIVLEMPFSENPMQDEFIEIIQVTDEKIVKLLRN
jgi:hypothetical protein